MTRTTIYSSLEAMGWNSWDEVRFHVTADSIYEIQRLAGEKLGNKIEYFILDDGWQYSWGDWRFLPTFLASAKEFCSKVKKAGGIPGIWLAPLYADKPMMDLHPEWFARLPDGSLVESVQTRFTLGCLDITVPEVEEHLFNIYKNLKQEGFDYFKVDFTQMVQKCTQFHDPTVGRGHIIRKTFETIRRAVGEDSYILACAPPYESVYGIVDAARTTADIQLKWSVVQFNIGSAACRWWMDRKLWNNDPDFLIVRAQENRLHGVSSGMKDTPMERGKYVSGRQFTAREARGWALLAVLLGEVVLGDDLRELNEEGLALVKRALELTPLNRSAVPVDLFTCGHNRLPSIWVADEDDRKIIALFNWDGEIERRWIKLSDYGISECYELISWFDNQPLTPSVDGTLSFMLKSHDSTCVVARLKKLK
jgi:hypothetical protein